MCIWLQGLLCGVLQVIVQKLSEADATKGAVMQCSDQCMEVLLGVFSANRNSVHEEAMLVVGALTYACGASFSKYLSHLFPIIELGLRNTAVHPYLPACLFACLPLSAGCLELWRHGCCHDGR